MFESCLRRASMPQLVIVTDVTDPVMEDQMLNGKILNIQLSLMTLWINCLSITLLACLYSCVYMYVYHRTYWPYTVTSILFLDYLFPLYTNCEQCLDSPLLTPNKHFVAMWPSECLRNLYLTFKDPPMWPAEAGQSSAE